MFNLKRILVCYICGGVLKSRFVSRIDSKCNSCKQDSRNIKKRNKKPWNKPKHKVREADLINKFKVRK